MYFVIMMLNSFRVDLTNILAEKLHTEGSLPSERLVPSMTRLQVNPVNIRLNTSMCWYSAEYLSTSSHVIKGTCCGW